MRKSLQLTSWIGGILLLLASHGAFGQSASVTYTISTVNKTRVHVIWVNLNDQRLMVQPVLAWDRVGQRQSFVSFLSVYQPMAQITGSYFSLRTSRPIGDVMIGGRLRWRGPVGTALAIRPDNRAEMINIPYGWLYSWPGYEHVIKGGVRLVKDGKYALSPREQGFRDPGLFRRATRTAVGIDRRNRLLMVAVGKPILLSDLAGIMKGLGCRDAMSLDGGTSTGLAHGVHVIMSPGRTLSSVLMVLPRPIKPPPPPPTDQGYIRPVPTANDTYLAPAAPAGTDAAQPDRVLGQHAPFPLLQMRDDLRAMLRVFTGPLGAVH